MSNVNAIHEIPDSNPAATKSHRICSVSIVGGFLDGARFEFAERLNCLIGPRGAGKSTVLELIRYALNALPGREMIPTERKRIESLVAKNLAGGCVKVEVETADGLRYIVRRAAGEEPMVLAADGKPTDIAVACELLQADIFGQNEVETIADRPESQLQLIDRLEAKRLAEIAVQIDGVRATLAANASETLPLQTQIATLGDELAMLVGIESKLAALSQTGEAPREINQAHALKSLRDRERRAVGDTKQFLTDLAKRIAALTDGTDANLSDRDVLAGPNGDIVREVFDELGRCTREAHDGLTWIAQRIAAAMNRITDANSRLSVVHKEQELAFQSLMERHRQAQGQAAERSALERRRNELLSKERSRERLRARCDSLTKQRAELIGRLSELHDERYKVRHAVACRINDALSPAIRVSVLQGNDREGFRSFLEDVLKPAKLWRVVVSQKLAAKFSPADLAVIVRSNRSAALIEVAELGPDQAEKVIAAFTADRLAELEAMQLDDLPLIELRDGENYKPASALSTGQKCTAILPILLMERANPLLIEQPEDNLDNRFIFEAVVESVRKVKSQRQLIFVTHNPNIPVLGDAERVFVLDSNGEASHTANAGSVDECKRDIVTLLEGGEDAFKARKRRYAY